MEAFFSWLDERLGYRRPLAVFRERVLPHGPGWWYTTGSCAIWLFIIECITGLLLMSSYSPSMASAWASVNFIDQTSAGRFLRGVHHYTSHALVVVVGLHLLRTLIARTYRAPRELIWITGLLMFPLVLTWTVTGNPLTGCQKGLSQIHVEGNILAGVPIMGPFFRQVLFGGQDIGNLTLTRLYFLHVGLLPMAVGLLLVLHLYQDFKYSPFRRTNTNPDATPLLPYWPYQTVRNITTLSLVFGGIAVTSAIWGAPLPAPADPDLPFSPRPEWYFRWLFELRKYFTGDSEFVATVVLPTVIVGVLMALPFLDRIMSPRMERFSRFAFMAAFAACWGWFTYLSYSSDWNDREYMASCVEFEELSARARLLARSESIPATGAIELLRQDPMTQGPRIFARNCKSCHEMKDATGVGIVAAEPSAPNLFGFGTTSWIAGLLDVDRISDDSYFGRSAFKDGDMKQHLKSLFENTDRDQMKQKLHEAAIALAAEAGHESYDSAEAVRGRALMVGELRCTECHQFGKEGDVGAAPTLTAYASEAWLKSMISNPRGEQYYGDRNDRMPSFASNPSHPELNLLSPRELDLLVTWLRSASGPSTQTADVNGRPKAYSLDREPAAEVASKSAP